MAQQRPASGCVPRARRAPLAFAAPALGIEQRAQVFEAVGGHQAGGNQFPNCVLHFAGESAGGPQQIRKKRCATGFEHSQNFPRRMRQRGSPQFALRRRLSVGQQPARVLA